MSALEPIKISDPEGLKKKLLAKISETKHALGTQDADQAHATTKAANRALVDAANTALVDIALEHIETENPTIRSLVYNELIPDEKHYYYNSVSGVTRRLNDYWNDGSEVDPNTIVDKMEERVNSVIESRWRFADDILVELGKYDYTKYAQQSDFKEKGFRSAFAQLLAEVADASDNHSSYHIIEKKVSNAYRRPNEIELLSYIHEHRDRLDPLMHQDVVALHKAMQKSLNNTLKPAQVELDYRAKCFSPEATYNGLLDCAREKKLTGASVTLDIGEYWGGEEWFSYNVTVFPEKGYNDLTDEQKRGFITRLIEAELDHAFSCDFQNSYGSVNNFTSESFNFSDRITPAQLCEYLLQRDKKQSMEQPTQQLDGKQNGGVLDKSVACDQKRKIS